jgi:hypothetical protein
MQERNTDTTEDATEEHRHHDHAAARGTVESSVTGTVTPAGVFNEESRHSRGRVTVRETPGRKNTAERTGDSRSRQPTRTVDATAGGVERFSLSFFVLLYRLLTYRDGANVTVPVTPLSTVRGGGR